MPDDDLPDDVLGDRHTHTHDGMDNSLTRSELMLHRFCLDNGISMAVGTELLRMLGNPVFSAAEVRYKDMTTIHDRLKKESPTSPTTKDTRNEDDERE